MKVIQFLPNLESGGVERGTLEIAKALVDAGHESHVVSNGGRLVAQLEREGSEHHAWPLHRKSPLTLLQVTRLRAWLRSMRPDIVHVRSRMPAWIVWLAWRKMGRAHRPKFLTTLHGLHSVSTYSSIMGRGERVIAVSNTAKQYLLDNYRNIDSDRIQVIHRGTNPTAFLRGYQPNSTWLQRWFNDYPQLADKRLICLPGRLTRLKGHDYLIRLIQQLKARGYDDVSGVIVGGADGSHEGYIQGLHTQIERLGVGNDIVFTGYRDDMRDIYAISSMVLAVSNKPESFGRTVLEPLSMGIPTLGFDIGGVGEVLATLYPDGRLPMQDDAALLQKATRILDGETQEIKENTSFSLDNMCQQTLGLYTELLVDGSP